MNLVVLHYIRFCTEKITYSCSCSCNTLHIIIVHKVVHNTIQEQVLEPLPSN